MDKKKKIAKGNKDEKVDWTDLFTDPGRFINEGAIEKIANDPKLMEIINKIK